MDGGGEMGRCIRKYGVDTGEKRGETGLLACEDDSGVSRVMIQVVRTQGGRVMGRGRSTR